MVIMKIILSKTQKIQMSALCKKWDWTIDPLNDSTKQNYFEIVETVFLNFLADLIHDKRLQLLLRFVMTRTWSILRTEEPGFVDIDKIRLNFHQYFVRNQNVCCLIVFAYSIHRLGDNDTLLSCERKWNQNIYHINM